MSQRPKNEEYLEDQPQWQPSGDGYTPSRLLRPMVVPEQWAEKVRPRDYPPPHVYAAPPGFQPPGAPPLRTPPQGVPASGAPAQSAPPPRTPPQGVPPQGFAPPPGSPPSSGDRPAYAYAPPGYPPASPPSPRDRAVYGYAPPSSPPPNSPPLNSAPPNSPRPEYLPRHSSPAPSGRRWLHKRNAVFLAIAGACAIAVVASALASSNKQAKSAATSSVSSGKASSSALAQAEDACAVRPPASGDIYVRTITPGALPQARTLSGNWGWDHATAKCLSAVQLAIATATRGPGQCTQVGYAAANPGYDVNAATAPHLTHIAAQVGPACASAAAATTKAPAVAPTAAAPTAARPPTPAAAPSTAHRTTPAAAPSTSPSPSTPAPATSAAVPASASAPPFSCYPVNGKGNCYEPGDYCRPYDAGVPGVAGDGESITCEDNDGWRWVSA